MKKVKSTEPKKRRMRKVFQDVHYPIMTSSISFKEPFLKGIREHDIVKKEGRSVSWVVNHLLEKFLAGDILITLS